MFTFYTGMHHAYRRFMGFSKSQTQIPLGFNIIINYVRGKNKIYSHT